MVHITSIPSLCVGGLHFFTYQMYGVNPNVGVESKLQPPPASRHHTHTHTHSQGLKSRALSLSLTSCVTLNKVLSLALIQFSHLQNQGMNSMHATELFWDVDALFNAKHLRGDWHITSVTGIRAHTHTSSCHSNVNPISILLTRIKF